MATERAPSTLEAYRAAVARPVEDIVEIDIDGLDRLGVPIVTVCTWVDGTFCSGTGYGGTREGSRLSAWGELVEATMPIRALRRMERRRASHAELAAEDIPVVDPLRLCLPVTTDYTTDHRLEWVEARRHPTGEPVLVPIEFAAQGPEDLESGPRLIRPITNGMGAGDTKERAIAHGLMELLQRDGNSVTYRALDRGIAIDLDQVTDAGIRELLGHLDEAGVDVMAKLAATDFGLTNIYVVGYDREPGRSPHPLSLTACGEAVHPDREVALGKALREFASSRVRKAFNHGPIGLYRHLLPDGYLDRFGDTGEERAFAAMLDWARLGPEAMLEHVRRPTLETRRRVPLSSLPTTPLPAGDPAAVLALLTERLQSEGLDILYVDFTPSGSPAHAVHVIIPGLEVETMTYHRIGPRNLRRLMEQDVDFVGMGEAPTDSLRVPLHPQDEAALGGRAWFDPQKADRALAGFFPLYREPGRHAVALHSGR